MCALTFTSDFCVAYAVSRSCSLELDTCNSVVASVRTKDTLTIFKVMVPKQASVLKATIS